METYAYDPTRHHLVMSGDGASWITTCRDYFQDCATFVIDRFHVARDIQDIFRKHPRYRAIRKKLAAYDAEGLMLELNSAVGTIGHEKKEERLEELINQLSQYPEALRDYRERLQSAEGTMSIFAKRLKQGRSWSDHGLAQLIHMFVGTKDQLAMKTVHGKWTPMWRRGKNNDKSPNHRNTLWRN